jgi:hypothetical protein
MTGTPIACCSSGSMSCPTASRRPMTAPTCACSRKAVHAGGSRARQRRLRLTLETAAVIAERTGADPKVIGPQLKGLASRGLIKAGRATGGLGFGLLPFIVGFYENQGPVIDAELAQLVEAYYRRAFGRTLADGPQFHRVIPVEQSVDVNMEVRPYESAAEIIARVPVVGRGRLHLPQAEGAHRGGVRSSAGRLHDV